jgi:hypothetical protein
MFDFRKSTVRAKKFVLEDDSGNERAVLEVDGAENTVLRFQQADGRTRMFLGLTKDGTPRMSLRYGGDKGCIELEANDEHNSAACLITGPEGVVQIIMALANNGVPVFALLNQTGDIIYQSMCKTDESGEDHFDWDSILKRRP